MKFLLAGLLFFTVISVQAQRVCGSTEYVNRLLATDATYKANAQTIQDQVNETLHGKKNYALRDTVSNEIIFIPVVVHVLYNNATENISDVQVKSQIDVLNKDYRRLNDDRVNTPAPFAALAGDARIQFCLAQVDPKGYKTTGIDRVYTTKDFFTTDDAMKTPEGGGVAAWDSKRYLNIWVCHLNGRSLGYATPPGAAADKDGLVIMYDVFGTSGTLRAVFNKGRTATHEIGHWLGLIHTWGDTNCGDDLVDDTPTQQSYNFGCPSFPKMSPCSPNANGDMFMNFMDFSDDACMNMFSKGQVARMRALFAKNNVRNTFLVSTACDGSNAEAGPLPTQPTVDTPQTTVKLASTRIYPNPVHDNIIIECKAAGSLTVKNIRIVSATGVVVCKGTLTQEKTTQSLSSLTPGLYIVQIEDGAERFTTKLVKF